MSDLTFTVERLLPCVCLALSATPFPDCPECGGCGESWQEIDLTIEYGYSRGMRGARDRYGVPLEPDDPEGVEIESVTDAAGTEVELTKAEEDRAEEACLRDAEERRQDAMEARAEAHYERLREGSYYR